MGGENQFHAIFGGDRSFIVNRWSPWRATFRVVGPSGERTVSAAEFFSLPRVDAKRENVLGKDEILASTSVPPTKPNSRSTYHKILDREA